MAGAGAFGGRAVGFAGREQVAEGGGRGSGGLEVRKMRKKLQGGGRAAEDTVEPAPVPPWAAAPPGDPAGWGTWGMVTTHRGSEWGLVVPRDMPHRARPWAQRGKLSYTLSQAPGGAAIEVLLGGKAFKVKRGTQAGFFSWHTPGGIQRAWIDAAQASGMTFEEGPPQPKGEPQ